MTLQELHKEIETANTELGSVLSELDEVMKESLISGDTPAIRNGGASLVAQCYSGIENILKRVAIFRDKKIPSGYDWHISLVKLFQTSDSLNSDSFVNDELFSKLNLMRKFRHVAHHGYGFKLNWQTVKTAAIETPEIVDTFMKSLNKYLAELEKAPSNKT
ncbi:MAG: hypothetical protein JNL74_16295 [Fibrobacteres bacterium]|nr:hypothetical protein [Fibrobacterota bacterium]